jgi:signal transduction histidine kinase
MSSERVRTFHQSLHTTTRQAYELLSNLLQWSRSQLDKITVNPESFDMSVLAEQNIPLHEQRAREKGIDLINHLEGRNFPVYADYQMITTVLRNLLSNAIKFTGNGGSVSLDAVEGDGFWEFQVSDTGMGIPEERLDKLFKLGESYSAPGTDEETGTGLGLVLCKEFVDKNGGTIYAFNKKGSGSTFSFTLPKTGSNHE